MVNPLTVFVIWNYCWYVHTLVFLVHTRFFLCVCVWCWGGREGYVMYDMLAYDKNKNRSDSR